LVTCALVASAACSSEQPSATSAPPAVQGSHEPSGALDEGGRILFLRDAENFLARVDGSEEQPFLPGEQIEVRSVSPDGSRLAFVAVNDDGRIVGGTVGVEGGDLRLFTSPDPSLNLACGWWGPNDRIACEGWDDEDPSRSGIYTVRASDGGGLRRLTRNRDYPCAYSPDGTHLAFIRVTRGIGTNQEGGRLMLIDADGGDARVLIERVGESGMACDWSPDGTTILAGRSDGSIVMVTPAGIERRFVAAGVGGYSEGFRWSPDGSHFLFSMNLDGQFDVYTVAADGSDLTRITDSEGYESGLAWLP
jgi:Tol biopolymer transport system component